MGRLALARLGAQGEVRALDDSARTAAEAAAVGIAGVVAVVDQRRLARVAALDDHFALRVLPALRDAEGDLHNWRRSPLRDLLERLPLDPANLQATASAISSRNCCAAMIAGATKPSGTSASSAKSIRASTIASVSINR